MDKKTEFCNYRYGGGESKEGPHPAPRGQGAPRDRTHWELGKPSKEASYGTRVKGITGQKRGEKGRKG